MKLALLLLIFFSSVLLASDKQLILKSYTTDVDVDKQDIKNYLPKFLINDEENEELKVEIILFNSENNSTIKQNNFHKFQWVMFTLDDQLPSGNYWINYRSFDFNEHTFTKQQHLDKFSLFGRNFFSFYYDKDRDSKNYFLKTLNHQSHVTAFASLYTPQTFSQFAHTYSTKMLLTFFLFGLIFMAAIYNGVLYLYNRDKPYIYYMIMQFFMLGILFYQTDLIQIYTMGDLENEEIAIFFYFILVEVGVIFVLLFARSFLEIKKHLPFHDKILKYIMIVIFIDFFLFFIPLMLIFQLYSFLLLYIVYLAWLRFRQGYKPALFFVFGWFIFSIGVFVSDYFDEESFYFEPILIGSTIEALFLAIAISYKVKTVQDEKEAQKELLVHQSKLASMGEMLGNIAHQWRQPLTRLGYILMNIEAKDKEKNHIQKLEEASLQLEFMSQTIDDFKDFYKPNKEKEFFSVLEETQKVITLLNLTEIEVIVQAKENVTILNYKNEFKQVILNILCNAKDVLIHRTIFSPKITIEINRDYISICDNAGGVKLKSIQKVFEPYFTTKQQGLGIGLYMSKVIVEKNMGGKLEVKNSESGALFTFSF